MSFPIHVQEREHGWLARELHDQLGQSLTVLSLALGAIESELSPSSRALAGGQLEIESAPGAGTTLRARFPAVRGDVV